MTAQPPPQTRTEAEWLRAFLSWLTSPVPDRYLTRFDPHQQRPVAFRHVFPRAPAPPR